MSPLLAMLPTSGYPSLSQSGRNLAISALALSRPARRRSARSVSSCLSTTASGGGGGGAAGDAAAGAVDSKRTVKILCLRAIVGSLSGGGSQERTADRTER